MAVVEGHKLMTSRRTSYRRYQERQARKNRHEPAKLPGHARPMPVLEAEKAAPHPAEKSIKKMPHFHVH